MLYPGGESVHCAIPGWYGRCTLVGMGVVPWWVWESGTLVGMYTLHIGRYTPGSHTIPVYIAQYASLGTLLLPGVPQFMPGVHPAAGR